MPFSMADQYRQIHGRERYGDSSLLKAPYIIPHIRALGARSVIDYGCGQSKLAEAIGSLPRVETVCRYEPAIPDYASRPDRHFDLVVSVDVLEHVPEPELDDVLADMRQLADHALLIIDIVPAQTILPNGENAHATVQPPAWWMDRLSRFWNYLEPFPGGRRPRARFKTWATRRSQRPLIAAESLYLRAKKNLLPASSKG
jgi:hypothetical protein